jgi:uncharacterized protein YjiS (DUF1127 family)
MAMLSLPSARPGLMTLLAPFTLLPRLPQLLALRRARKRLATLDAAALRDIGLSPEAAQAEAARTFWDAPDHWLR